MSYARKLLIDGVEIADVIIPDTIDEIKPFTFYRCYSLSNIVLSTNLMSINDESFSDCIGLSTVEIPSHVSSISQSSFRGCINLTLFIVDETNEHYSTEDGMLLNTSKEFLVHGINNDNFTLNGVLSIGDYAFENYELVSSAISNLNNVKYIGEASFYATNAESISFSNSLTSIGPMAYAQCENLCCISFGNSSLSIFDNAFDSCYSLTSVNIIDIASWCKSTFVNGSNPLQIAQNLFINNILAENLTIPTNVDEIYPEVFIGCTSLISVSIPGSINTISSMAFGYCSNIQTIHLYSGTENIADNAFVGCDSLQDVFFYGKTFDQISVMDGYPWGIDDPEIIIKPS